MTIDRAVTESIRLLEAMDDHEYRRVRDVAARASITVGVASSRIARLAFLRLIESTMVNPHYVGGNASTVRVYAYRRTPGAIQRLRTA